MTDAKMAQEVRRALRHLDDVLYLEDLELAQRLSAVVNSADLTRGQALQRTVRLVIASLEPSGNHEADDVDSITYQVLYQYAIARRTVVAIAGELGISERKAYYALERASRAVATILRDLMNNHSRNAAPPTPALRGESSAAARVRCELARLASAQSQDVEMRRLLQEVVRSLEPLAESCQVRVALHTECGPLRVAAKRVLLRQAYLNLISYAIANSRDGRLEIALTEEGGRIHVEIVTALADQDDGPEGGPLAVAIEIIEALGLGWQRTLKNDGCTAIAVHLSHAPQKVVLVVDDNEGVIALMRRYLRDQPYVVYGANDADEADRMTDELEPDVIILDIMLPYQDGWEVLNALRHKPACRDTPIIVCSIINDPQLAMALGAAAFLLKPVDRASLLQALETALSAET